MQTLATTLHYPSVEMEDLHQMAPAFDVLPFAEALERECLALRDENDALVLVMGDPFDTDLQAWAEQRIAASFSWCLAHRADVAAYLARHEETLHAMDSLLPSGEQATPAQNAGPHDLSFKTISEDTSPVVKLVHSTVYDALKASASDIHLETGPGGLSIKYRIDGVLTTVGSLAGPGTGRAGDFAHQGHVRTRHRRAAHAPGRALQGVGARARGGFPRLHHAQHLRRGRGAAHPRQAGPVRPDQGAAPRAIWASTSTSMAVLRRLASEPYGMLLVTGPTG